MAFQTSWSKTTWLGKLLRCRETLNKAWGDHLLNHHMFWARCILLTFSNVTDEKLATAAATPVMRLALQAGEVMSQILNAGGNGWLWLKGSASVLLSEGCWSDSPGPHVEVSLGKILNPKLFLMCWLAPCEAAFIISLGMFVWITVSCFGQKCT